MVFLCFQGVEKQCIENKWVKTEDISGQCSLSTPLENIRKPFFAKSPFAMQMLFLITYCFFLDFKEVLTSETF